MFSFTGPQHGRILHAFFDHNQQRLVIRRTELHSFERKDTAPFDLYLHYLLSEPVKGERDAQGSYCVYTNI